MNVNEELTQKNKFGGGGVGGLVWGEGGQGGCDN